MEARIKRLFSSKKSSSRSSSSSKTTATSELKGFSYDSASTQQPPPIRGNLPVAGNRKINLADQWLQNHASSKREAPPPDISRTPRRASLQRPKTASNAQPADQRSFSGFSMIGPPTFLRPRASSSSTARKVKPCQANPILPPLPLPHMPTHIRNSSSYVDIMAASTLKTHASGTRDYGEDVADRNMDVGAAQASDLGLNINSPDFAYMKLMYWRQTGSINKGWSSRNTSCAGSARRRGLKEEDDDELPNPVFRPVETRISSDGRPNDLDRTKRAESSKASKVSDQLSDSILVLTQNSVVSAYRPTGLPNAVSSKKTPILPTRSTARPRSLRMRETMRDDSSSSKSTSGGSIGGGAVKAAAAAIAAAVAKNENVRPVSASGSQTRPLTASRSAAHKEYPLPLQQQRPTTIMNNRQPTPPMSPESTQVSSAITNPKTKSVSRTRALSAARNSSHSASYSPFPKPRQSSVVFSHTGDPSAPSTDYANDGNSRAKTANTRGRTGQAVKEAPEAPSLEGVVDLSSTADTTVSGRVLPAVTHETVVPKVRNIREEQITREIHTHDVFHRILPVIETEILPTKHYIRNSAGGLTEIPASDVPGRQEHWRIEESPRSSNTSFSADSVAPPAIPIDRGHGSSVSARPKTATASFSEPVMTSSRTSTMSSGGIKTESVWRHPPTWENSDRQLGQGYGQDGSYDTGSESEYSRSHHSEDSAFLFSETGYGGRGLLPGLTEALTEASPIVPKPSKEDETKRRLANTKFGR